MISNMYYTEGKWLGWGAEQVFCLEQYFYVMQTELIHSIVLSLPSPFKVDSV